MTGFMKKVSVICTKPPTLCKREKNGERRAIKGRETKGEKKN